MAVRPAQAAPPISCQAIDATGLLSGPPPAVPGPLCPNPVSVGDTFEIDFSNVFASDPGSFLLTNSYSLQIANINTISPGSELSFTDVELLITGALGVTPITTPTAISIWQDGAQTGQGFSAFSTNGPGQDFGFGTAYKSANFTLKAPQPPSTFGRAGVINTLAFNLQLAGVTEFRSAKLRGKLSGATGFTSQPAFSAGIGIFSTNNPATQAPNIIYGNAFNTTVPGPLPVLGAGAAFGFSRRLRRRMMAASSTR